jgi:hypothetical protein
MNQNDRVRRSRHGPHPFIAVRQLAGRQRQPPQLALSAAQHGVHRIVRGPEKPPRFWVRQQRQTGPARTPSPVARASACSRRPFPAPTGVRRKRPPRHRSPPPDLLEPADVAAAHAGCGSAGSRSSGAARPLGAFDRSGLLGSRAGRRQTGAGVRGLHGPRNPGSHPARTTRGPGQCQPDAPAGPSACPKPESKAQPTGSWSHIGPTSADKRMTWRLKHQVSTGAPPGT